MPIGDSFDPNKKQPVSSPPGQALQIVGLHLPRMFSRGAIVPQSLATAPSHLGNTPEALLLSNMMQASRAAGTDRPDSNPVPQNPALDLTQILGKAMSPAAPADQSALAPSTPQVDPAAAAAQGVSPSPEPAQSPAASAWAQPDVPAPVASPAPAPAPVDTAPAQTPTPAPAAVPAAALQAVAQYASPTPQPRPSAPSAPASTPSFSFVNGPGPSAPPVEAPAPEPPAPEPSPLVPQELPDKAPQSYNEPSWSPSPVPEPPQSAPAQPSPSTPVPPSPQNQDFDTFLTNLMQNYLGMRRGQ